MAKKKSLFSQKKKNQDELDLKNLEQTLEQTRTILQ